MKDRKMEIAKPFNYACGEQGVHNLLCMEFFSSRTFAAITLKERLPRVLTTIIDTVHRHEAVVTDSYGAVCKDRIITMNLWVSIPFRCIFWCRVVGRH